MKKLFFLIASLLISGLTYSQITISGSVGVDGVYTSLTNASGAFAAINGATQTGANIIISITGDVATEAGTNSLNSGAWNSLTINPSGIRTVSGTVAGAPLINLNGAKKVCINGLNDGSNSLVISNLSTAATAGTSTIRFIADASNDTISNCTILGSNTATVASIAGTILFSTGTTTGNDNNVISNNKIGDAGAGTSPPSSCITSSGTSTTISNDNNVVTGNSIYNWYANSGANAINIIANSSAWNISSNKFYLTTIRTGLTSSSVLKCINIVTSSGSGYSISNNTFGYGSSAGTGMLINNNGCFTGIDVTVASSPVSTIQGNSINNIRWTTSNGVSTAGSASFNGIIVRAGGVNINGNTIGNMTGVASTSSGIYVTTTTTGTGTIPIYLTSATACTIQNNNIGAIGIVGDVTLGYTFYGIYIAGAGAQTVTGNTIGSAVSGSVSIGITGTTVATCNLYGIISTSTGALTIGSLGNGNTIQNLNHNSSGVGLIYGIYNIGAITGTNSFSYNTFDNLNFNAASTSAACALIYNTGAATTSTLKISNNTFGSNAANYTGATGGTGVFNGIYQAGTPKYDTISNNVFNNMSLKSSGAVNLIYNHYTAPASGTKTVQNNSITTGFTRTVTATGNFLCYYDAGNVPSTASITISGNNFSNITGSSSFTFYGIYSTNTSAGPIQNVYNNTISNINFTGSASVVGINLGCYNNSTNPSQVYGNIISNFNSSGTAALYGIYAGSSGFYASIHNNTISNLNQSGSGAVYGMYSNSGSTLNFYQNAINTLTGGGSVNGIYVANGTIVNIYQHQNYNGNNYSIYGLTSSGETTAANGIAVIGGSTVNVYQNNIYNISNSSIGSTVLVNGIFFSGGLTIGAYNNTIGNLTTPNANYTEAIRGIAVVQPSTATNRIYFNTVYLNGTSSGSDFGSSALYHEASSSATYGNLDARNNILVNTCVAKGSGMTIAHHQTNAYLQNFASTSNNNLYYAGTPSAKNLIFYDGTTADSTINNYTAHSGMSPRESFSVTENPNWLNSTDGANVNYLHINPASPTQIESGAANVTSVPATDDIDGNVRQGNAGYSGTGFQPDMGADEFGGIALSTCPTPNPGNTLATANVICLGQTITLSLQNMTSNPNVTFQWQSSSDSINYVDITGANSSSYTFVPQLDSYFRCMLNCINETIYVASTPVKINWDYNILSSTGATHCGPASLTLTASANKGTIIWYSSSTGNSAVGTGSSFITPLLSNTTSYWVEANAGTVVHGGKFPQSWSSSLAPSTNNYGLVFDVSGAFLLNSVDVYNINATGTLKVQLQNSLGTPIYTSGTFTIPTGGSSTPYTVPLGWSIPIGTGYRMIAISGTAGLVYESASFPISLGSWGNVTAGAGASSYYFYFYNWNMTQITGGCTAPRVQVMANITPTAPMTITADQTTCNNAVGKLSVTSNTADFNTYIWSPTSKLFIDSLGTIAYTGQSATTVYFRSTLAGTYPYVCTATNTSSQCTNIDTTVVTNVAAPVISASAFPFCGNVTTTITTSPDVGFGSAVFQWQNATDSIHFNDIAGANLINYTTPDISNTYFYKLRTMIGSAVCNESNIVKITVYNPLVNSTTPASLCGTGQVTLSATPNSTSTLSWYAASSGGSSLGSGNTYTTPVLSTTTPYWVEPAYSNFSSGGGRLVPNTTLYAGYTARGLVFDVTTAFTLNSVDVYIQGAGSIVVKLANSYGNTVQTSSTFTVPSGSGNTPYTLNLGWAIPVGSGYRLILNSTSTYYSIDNAAAFPYPLGNMGSITSGYYAGVSPDYYYFYNWKISAICSGPRVQVNATITPSPTLSITSNQTTCNNTVGIMMVTSNVADYTSYVWSPTTNLFNDSLCTVAYTGTNKNTVYYKNTIAGSTTYTCTANNSTSQCFNSAASIITNLPAPSITATPSSFCGSGASSLNTLPSTGYGAATFQWLNSADSIIFNPIAGANLIYYNTPTLTSSIYYKLQILIGSNLCSESNIAKVTVSNPQITNTIPATRCGIGTLTLGATASAGSNINWYTVASGGTSTGSGSSYTTPVISTSTSYWAEPSMGSGNFTGGKLAPTVTSSAAPASYGLVFDVTTAFTLNSVEVYNTLATSGTFVIQLQNSSGTVLQTSGTFTVPAGTGTTAYAATLGWSIPVGTGYRLLATTGTATLVRELSLGFFPYSLGSVGNITSGYISGTSTTYYYFYNWNITSGCTGSRVQVNATVAPPPTLTISPNLNACNNTFVKLSVTSNIADYNSYVWSPSTKLFSDSLCTIAYTGTNAANVFFKSTTTGIFSYTCTANNSSTLCSNVANSTITVNVAPSGASASASNDNICIGSSINLTSSAISNLSSSLSYSEGFETWTPSGWTFINAGSGNPWASSTTYYSGAKAMSYTYNTTYTANAWGITPGQLLTAGTSYTISFWYKVNSATYPEKLKVTVGTAATVAGQTTILWNNNGGASLTNVAWAQGTVNYTPIVNGTYYFGFNCYSAANMYTLYVDDVSITGSSTVFPTYSWTSIPTGFTSNLQNPSGVSPSVTTQYIMIAQNPNGCSASATKTVTVNNPTAPTGDAFQTYSNIGTVADLVAIGTSIKWYNAPTGGSLLLSTTTLVDGQTYYASQTVGGCESQSRLAVTVSFGPPPAVTVSTMPISNITNTSVTLNGQISSSGANNTVIRGFVVAKHSNPALGNPLTTVIQSGTGLGTYSFADTALTPNSDYWVSAFAINVLDTSYGAILHFKTGIWPYFQLELKNDSCVSDRVYEFDVYLKHTGNYETPVQFELSSFQSGIYFNSAILNGGTATATIVPGSNSELNSVQQQSNSNMFIVGPASGNKTIKVTAKLASAGLGTIISSTNGTRIMRIRLTNSIAFAYLRPNMSFSFTTVGPSWSSIISAYVNAISVNINANGTWVASNLNNPILNINLFNMTGGGTYCGWGAPVIVGVDGSQTGINYQLKKDGVNYGASVVGTGSPLTWNITEAGNYTCTSDFGAMNGSAEVTVFSAVAPTGNAIQSVCDADTLNEIQINGSNIKWYDAASGGNLLLSNNATIGGNTYYASQTIAGCESQTRLGISMIDIKTLNLHLYLEGLFDHNTNKMIEAFNGDTYLPQWGLGISDKINIGLYHETPPYTLIYSQNNVSLTTDGGLSSLIPCVYNENYYIAISNRNHIQTWSAMALPFNTPAISYDFSTDMMQAYGVDAQVQVASNKYAFYIGDLDQGGWVDSDDFNLFEPDITFGAVGFYNSDFNGGGWVDSDDFNLFEPRLTAGVASQSPGKKK